MNDLAALLPHRPELGERALDRQAGLLLELAAASSSSRDSTSPLGIVHAPSSLC